MRIGILGTGSISRWWLDSVRGSSAVMPVTVASRDAARARAFAHDAGLPHWHDSYRALLDDPEIDAVYIALRNGLHAEWSIAAAGSGKHVLCEKPLARSGAEAAAMFAAAHANKVVLLEAFAYRFTAQARQVGALLAEGAIGRPILVRTNTSYVRSDGSADDRPLGSGALMDSGCYGVSIARLVMGRAPLRVHAAASYGASGLDQTLVAALDFGAGAFGQISCSYVATSAPQTQIVGSDGAIETGFENASWQARPLPVRIKRGRSQDTEFEEIRVDGTDGYLAETDAFAAMARGETISWPGISERESIDIAATLDALQQSARSETWMSPALP